jgi:hypothetical protein
MRNVEEGVEAEKTSKNVSNTSRRPGPTRLRVWLGLQDQSAIKWTLRTHPDSVFDDPRMGRKIIS